MKTKYALYNLWHSGYRSCVINPAVYITTVNIYTQQNKNQILMKQFQLITFDVIKFLL